MIDNLLREDWSDLDSAELRLLLDERVGGPGQYHDRANNPNTLYLPLGGASCQIVLTFRNKQIVSIERGPAFDTDEWEKVIDEIENSILAGPMKIGREYSFSGFRVSGSWRGELSEIQILPAPVDAPRADVEVAEHPFILEFPMKECALWRITNYRRMREHRRLTHVLNLLLAGGTSIPPGVSPRQREALWASVDGEIKWVQRFYSAKLGPAVIDELSPPANEQLVDADPEEYYSSPGYDGEGLRVPADLDQSLSLYLQLAPTDRAKFDRATFWIDLASTQWTVSFSASFASLVSGIESLVDRGTTHHVYCDQCQRVSQHDVPGATEGFRAFIEKYAPGASLKRRRTTMYRLRSGILHGSELMQMDEDLGFGWDPPGENERELHEELWSLTRVALRNWLKHPPNV